MMNTRKVTLIATIAVIALIGVSIGYAYTSTMTTTDNDIDVQSIMVTPLKIDGTTTPATETEKYTGSTADVQFDTSKVGTGSWMYGVSILSNPASTPIKKSNNEVISTNYQFITDVNTIRITSEGDVQKALSGLTITIKGNDTLTTQLSTGEYKNAVIKAILKDSAGKTCVLTTPAVDVSGHNLIFSTSFSNTDAESGFILNIGDLSAQTPVYSTDYTFYFIIEGENSCTHAAKLNEGAFQIEYKATA